MNTQNFREDDHSIVVCARIRDRLQVIAAIAANQTDPKTEKEIWIEIRKIGFQLEILEMV